jgi:hypothetical protein
MSVKLPVSVATGALLLIFVNDLAAQTTAHTSLTKAVVDCTDLGWRLLDQSDFVDVNCGTATWSWKDGSVRCLGNPTGVIRSTRQFTNFEFVVQWKHLQAGGNSGVFVWVPEAALQGLKPDVLPASGIEIQILDHAYTQQYQQSTGEKADWFTTDGDIFPVGTAKMKPFPPISPGGERAFPRKQLSKGAGEWNTYYIRCINGEVRLWVNGEEVSGGNNCDPRSGYICLESEGAPVEFKELHIRELP